MLSWWWMYIRKMLLLFSSSLQYLQVFHSLSLSRQIPSFASLTSLSTREAGSHSKEECGALCRLGYHKDFYNLVLPIRFLFLQIQSLYCWDRLVRLAVWNVHKSNQCDKFDICLMYAMCAMFRFGLLKARDGDMYEWLLQYLDHNQVIILKHHQWIIS